MRDRAYIRILLFPTAGDVAGKKSDGCLLIILCPASLLFLYDPLWRLQGLRVEAGSASAKVCHQVATTGLHFCRCLVSLSHIRVNPHRVRRARSLAFSLRELEIELHMLTQSSDYATRCVSTDDIYRAEPKPLKTPR
jgi:hypothetical protein